MYYEIKITGTNIIAKKNNYAPKKNGGWYKPDKVIKMERDVYSQIPAELYGMNLVSPAMELKIKLPKANHGGDRDNILTSILDMLVSAKVIKDDCIRSFNGPLYVHPVSVSKEKEYIIRLYPCGNLLISDDLK